MKRYVFISGLLILITLTCISCEDQIDFQHRNSRLNDQLKWETYQRKGLQQYIDYVLNARYEANAFGSSRRKAWKIKDPISSHDLLAIMQGKAPAYLPSSLEIIEMESVNPAPPNSEELPGGGLPGTQVISAIVDTTSVPPLEIKPGADSNTASQEPIGQLSNLDPATATRRVGVSRGIPAAGSEAKSAVVPGGSASSGVVRIAEQNRIPLQLKEELLFNSGSTKLNQSGRRVVAALARELRSYPSHLIMVEGHTDNIEVSNLGDIKDNWDLSVMRANAVVRVLVSAGIPPQNLIASGRGEYFPIQPNSSAAGRESNRRVEIVLTPWPNP